jgi:hypothetical protein
MANDNDNKLSRYDAPQVLKHVHNEADEALNVTQVNDLVPRAFSKVEIDYIASGDGKGEPGEARYYSNGAAECTRITTREDEQGDPEVSNIEFGTKSPAALAGKYLIIYDSAGSVGVWFDLDNSSTPPTTGALRDIEVDIASADSTSTIASKFSVKMHSDSEFVSSVSDTLVMVTSNTIGNKTNATDINTGLTITITDGNDVNRLGGKYFNLFSASDETTYYVWYDVDDGSVDPAPGGTGIEVDIIAGETAEEVALKTSVVLDAHDDFKASAENDKLFITNAKPGSTTDTSDGDSEFTFLKLQDGTDKTIIATLLMTYNSSKDLTLVERIDP